MKILIAEDEDDIRRLLALNMKKEGYEVIECKDGIEALEAFKNQEVHLALLDIMMPNIDGITVMEEIRKTSVIPIIFITAMSTDSDKVLALGLGADDYIVKPINTIELTARVASQLSRCYQYVNNKEEKQEYLTIININSRRATKIITDLFEFSLLDSMDYKLNMKNVDVNEVLREIVAYYIPELEAKDFNYDFNISEEEYLVNIDEVKFTRAISNLIDNAIKYNEKNTTLSVISRKFNDRIEIRIFDDGRGINEEIRDKIFEAFVREDKARSSSTEGAGLGLAITKAIIEKHSGSIKLLDNTKGTEYKIILNI